MTINSDAIFHYTNADGLHGIMSNGEIWSTAFFTTNDASELNAGEGVLSKILTERAYQLFFEKHEYVDLLRKRGGNIFEHANRFESLLFKATTNVLQIYITCFCRSNSESEFQDGLLSQWRAYGRDNGYALQFSRSKLTNWIREIHQNGGRHTYLMDDVHYDLDNKHKEKVLLQKDSYLEIYINYLDKLVEMEKEFGPLSGLIDITPVIPSDASMMQAIQNFLLYRLLTKNKHFSEEKECRMSTFVTKSFDDIQFFNRNGVLVPYIKTPQPSETFLDCIESIIVGPGANQELRYQSVKYLLNSLKSLKKEISIRLSQIPYTGS